MDFSTERGLTYFSPYSRARIAWHGVKEGVQVRYHQPFVSIPPSKTEHIINPRAVLVQLHPAPSFLLLLLYPDHYGLPVLVVRVLFSAHVGAGFPQNLLFELGVDQILGQVVAVARAGAVDRGVG